MHILFHMPRSTFDDCFAPRDVERLTSEHEVVLPVSSKPIEITEHFAAHANSCEAIVTGWGTPPLTAALLDAAPNLRVVLHSAGSVHYLVPRDFWERGIRLASCNGALAIGVAETTLGLIITGLKAIIPTGRRTARGLWRPDDASPPWEQIREPFDVTVGIIGASKVGRHVMRLLQAFEMRVLVYDPYLSDDEAASLGVERAALDDLMAASDVVTLHAPSLPATKHMLRREHFGAMKDGAVFINTARGDIVDEAALVDELQAGRIFAFLDVTDPEPPLADHPFRTLSNVVLTPHLAGHAANGMRRQGRSAVDQLLAFGNDKPMEGEITREMIERIG